MTYFPIIFVVSNSLKSGKNIFTSGVFSLFTQFDYENYVQAWSGVSPPLLNTIIVAALSIVLGRDRRGARRVRVLPAHLPRQGACCSWPTSACCWSRGR